MKRTLAWAILLALPLTLVAGGEQVDLATVNRIKTEAFEHSKVMDHLFYLTDVYGPRMAASPNYRKAADWTVKQMTEWGLQNARTEQWGTFGRSWTWTRVSVQMLEPQQTTMIAVPLAWSPATAGAVTGEAVLAPMAKLEDAEKFKGKLKGKIVLIQEEKAPRTRNEADSKRYTDAELADRALASEPAAPARVPGAQEKARDMRQERNKLNKFLKSEGALAILTTSIGGGDGTIFTAPAGARESDSELPPPTVALPVEQYNRLVRLAAKNVPVKLEVDVRTAIDNENAPGFNVVAEIPGTTKKDEIVMLGAHLDSWHAGTGATDNAAGCAVVLEAVRILKALGLKMDRTVRIGLWDAEEEGIIGSREYVTAHFADPKTMQTKPEYARLSGYFNYDNGSGKIRGVYMQGNDMMRPIFEAWFEPFRDLGAATLTIRNTGGTDHLSFDAVGLPGFQFIQDPLDYGSRTHHTNMDVYDKIRPGDLMQSAAIMASFVYNAATRPEMLPRKPMPVVEKK